MTLCRDCGPRLLRQSQQLENAAKIVIEKCLGVKKDETVLIITDLFAEKIGNALYDAALPVCKDIMFIKTKPTGEQSAEPQELVAKAMERFDAILCPTQFSLTHTKATKRAIAGGGRVATLPGITEECFKRAIDIDYDKLKRDCEKLGKIFEDAGSIKITTESGTNINFSIEGRKPILDNGMVAPGDYGNLPGGEVFIAPVEGTANGILIVDSLQNCNPKTKFIVKNGKVIKVDGDDAFKRKMWEKRNARNIAEFGVGLNPKATLSGITLEEEKVLGTIHIAFGSNFTFGGKVKAAAHWDGVYLRPTVYFDDKKVMVDGQLLI